MNNKEALSHRDFIRTLLVSGLTILLSMTCLVSASWAWFSEGLSAPSVALSSVSYELTAVIDGREMGGEAVLLEAGSYEISLLPSETTSCGYCVVGTSLEGAGEACSSTVTIPKGCDDFSFTLVLSATTSLTLSPSLGISAASGIASGGTLHVSADGAHTVE